MRCPVRPQPASSRLPETCAMQSLPHRSGKALEETLDPEDWSDARAVARQAVDDAIEYLRDIRDRPVWRNMPNEVRKAFQAPLPHSPTPLSEVYREVAETVMPYPMGNIHPRFWAWYMGSSNFTGALADFLAAIQGSNLGGGNHAAARMDQQVVDWCKEMIGFPASTSGSLVSGGSMANTVALIVARNVKAGVDVREQGVAAIERPLRFYASDQLHSCHRKAIEAMGLGNSRASTHPDRRRSPPRPRCARRGHRARPCGRISTGMRDRQCRDRQHRRDRRSPGHRRPGGAGEPLVPCGRMHRCADRHRARQTPIAFAAWSAPIPSRLTRTNGCMRPSKSDASWFATPPPIGRASRWHRNIWERRRAGSLLQNGSMNMACKPAADFAP